MPTNGWGNIYCNSFSGDTALASGGGFTGLLDDYPGAAAAYSLRLLRSDYSGGLVRVMAWNGLASQGEADIMPYKVGDDYVVDLNSTLENLDAIAIGRGLTTSDTLADLVLTGTSNYDGLTPAWYDQGLLGNNAIQASAAAQPQIISSGSLILDNGKPTINYNSKSLVVSSASIGVNRSIFASFSSTISSLIRTIMSMRMDGGAVTDRFAMYADTAASRVHSQTDEPTGVNDVYNNSSALLINQMYLQTYMNNTSQGEAYLNGILQETISQSYSIGTYNILIGYQDASPIPFVGNLSELLIYGSYQDTNRTGIETNINDFYNIYP